MLLLGFFQQQLRQGGSVLAEIVGGALLLAMVALLAHFGGAGSSSCSDRRWRLSPCWRSRGPWRGEFSGSGWDGNCRSGAGCSAGPSLLPASTRSISSTLAPIRCCSPLWSTAASVGLYGVASKIYDTCLGLSMLLSGWSGRSSAVVPMSIRQGSRRFSRPAGAADGGCGRHSADAVGVRTRIRDHRRRQRIRCGCQRLAGLSLLLVIGPTRVLFRDVAAMLDVQRRPIAGSVLGAVVGFAGYAILIPRFGAVGAALALLLAELTVAAQAAFVLIGAGRTACRFGCRCWPSAVGWSPRQRSKDCGGWAYLGRCCSAWAGSVMPPCWWRPVLLVRANGYSPSGDAPTWRAWPVVRGRDYGKRAPRSVRHRAHPRCIERAGRLGETSPHAGSPAWHGRCWLFECNGYHNDGRRFLRTARRSSSSALRAPERR